MRIRAMLPLVVVLLLTGLFVAAEWAEGCARRGGPVSLRGSYRKDGTYVRPHTLNAQGGTPDINASAPGNYNPNTGTVTIGDPKTYLDRYYQRGAASVERAAIVSDELTMLQVNPFEFMRELRNQLRRTDPNLAYFESETEDAARHALWRFQAMHELPAHGQLDIRTLTRLVEKTLQR